MGVWNVGGREGATVADTRQMLGMFLADAMAEVEKLQAELDNDPMQFEVVERKVQELFNHGAGLFLTGLIAKSMKQPDYQIRCEQNRNAYVIPLKKGEDRQIQVRLANGFVCHATTCYCPPLRGTNQQDDTPGLDIELSQFGFSGGDSPALVSKIARTTALTPSLAQACNELNRDGIKLDKSVIDRISSRAAQELLTVRQRDIEQFHSGTLTSTGELVGKRVSVQIDGGRTRIRGVLESICPVENFGKSQSAATGKVSLGRSKESRRKSSFEALWREPKVITIYVHDADGRMEKNTRVTIDGTFGNCESIQTIVAMHLHRLGAAQAESISFNSDGAKWIWDRIDTILQLAKIPASVCVHRILDVYHACENLNKAVAALKPEATPRREFYKDLRTKLRDGKWETVVAELEQEYLATYPQAAPGQIVKESVEQKECLRVINYLRHHGQQGHMKYGLFKLVGLPLGSGAIESAIRRVINLRMKGNGIFWGIQRAEEMLMLRSTILSDRWDENRSVAKRSMKANQKLALPTLQTTETDEQTKPIKTQ